MTESSDSARQLAETVVWEHVGFMSFMYIGPDTPSKPEWDAFIAEITPLTERGRTRGVLVQTDGGGPNTLQRKSIVELEAASPFPGVPMAILVDSPITRGIVTALSWLKLNIKPFAPDRMVEAYRYLAESDCTRGVSLEEAQEHLAKLKKRLYA